MILIIKGTDDFCQKIWKILGGFFDKLDGSQDSFLFYKLVIAANAFEDFFVKLVRQFRSAHLAQNAESQADEVVIGVSQINSDTVSGHHKELGFLVEELSESQVADSLLDESATGDELEALHLTKVGFLAGHVDEEEFGDVSGSHALFIFLSQKIYTAKLYLMTAIYF